MALSALRKRIKDPDVVGILAMVGMLALISWPTLAQDQNASTARKRLQAVYSAEVERYDAQRIPDYLLTVGLRGNYEWCAAFVSWSFAEAGFSQPRTPWSPSLLPQARRIWQPIDGQPAGIVQAGDVFGIYIQQKKRIGHVGFVNKVEGNWLETVEGNTTSPQGIGPAGLYHKRRPWRTIKAIADWVSDNPSNTNTYFFNP